MPDDCLTSEYFPESGTSTKASSVSRKRSSMDDILSQDIITVSDYPTTKAKKRVMGRVQIKQD
jgi:hypothetical protein